MGQSLMKTVENGLPSWILYQTIDFFCRCCSFLDFIAVLLLFFWFRFDARSPQTPRWLGDLVGEVSCVLPADAIFFLQPLSHQVTPWSYLTEDPTMERSCKEAMAATTTRGSSLQREITRIFSLGHNSWAMHTFGGQFPVFVWLAFYTRIDIFFLQLVSSFDPK